MKNPYEHKLSETGGNCAEDCPACIGAEQFRVTGSIQKSPIPQRKDLTAEELNAKFERLFGDRKRVIGQTWELLGKRPLLGKARGDTPESQPRTDRFNAHRNQAPELYFRTDIQSNVSKVPSHRRGASS
jgi:hypothetical protein